MELRDADQNIVDKNPTAETLIIGTVGSKMWKISVQKKFLDFSFHISNYFEISIFKKNYFKLWVILDFMRFFLDRTFENIMALCVIRSGICWFAFEYQKWNWLRPLLWRCIFWTSVGSSKIFLAPFFREVVRGVAAAILKFCLTKGRIL